MEEKRRYKRISTKSIVMYRIEDYSQIYSNKLVPVETPLSVDISAGGMQFISRQNIPSSTLLKIVLSPEGTSKAVDIIGKVAWTKSSEESSGYQVGIEFLDILSNKKVLEDYIKSKE